MGGDAWLARAQAQLHLVQRGAGVDQRLIDDWVGHTTEEMRRRYRHLIPSVQKQAIRSVFGNE